MLSTHPSANIDTKTGCPERCRVVMAPVPNLPRRVGHSLVDVEGPGQRLD